MPRTVSPPATRISQSAGEDDWRHNQYPTIARHLRGCPGSEHGTEDNPADNMGPVVVWASNVIVFFLHVASFTEQNIRRIAPIFY
jgi:hypothetical protein